MSCQLNFQKLNADLLSRSCDLLPQWLPNGRFKGRAFVAGSVRGEAGDSLSVSVDKGIWKDFATGEGGGDLISLYAAIHGIKQGEAARRLMGDMGSASQAMISNPKPTPSFKQLIDWQARYERARATLDPGEIHDAADAIGLSGEGYDALGVCVIEDLYGFPERDATGRIIGIVKRTIAGKKIAVKGSTRGLTYQFPLPTADPVLIVEGASDTAAAIEAGFNAVGRPSATGGAEMLAKLLHGRAAVIVGENDAKPDGQWPGRDGAERIKARLRSCCRSVKVIYPPVGTKDLRRWLTPGGAV